MTTAIGLAVLLLPVAVVASRRAAARLDPVEAVAVGVGAVAALLVLAGLALSALGALETAGWVVVVVAADAAALLAVGDRARLARRALVVALAGGAVGLTVGAVAVSRESARDHARETRFTQLWFLQGDAQRAELGVRNHERRTIAFRVRVWGPASQGRRLLLDRTIALAAGRSWTTTLVLPRTDRPERVSAELHRPGDPAAYRSAHVWTDPL